MENKEYEEMQAYKGKVCHICNMLEKSFYYLNIAINFANLSLNSPKCENEQTKKLDDELNQFITQGKICKNKLNKHFYKILNLFDELDKVCPKAKYIRIPVKELNK